MGFLGFLVLELAIVHDALEPRLDQLAGLLDGMGHLGDAETMRIGERIAELRTVLVCRH